MDGLDGICYKNVLATYTHLHALGCPEWAEGMIEPSRLAREGFFDSDAVWQAWNEHQGGRQNRQYPLWNLLMFQAWLGSL